MDRPCIDPLDPDCPPSAPNFYDVCPVIDLVLNFTKEQNATLEAEKEKDEYDLFDMLGGRKLRWSIFKNSCRLKDNSIFFVEKMHKFFQWVEIKKNKLK